MNSNCNGIFFVNTSQNENAHATAWAFSFWSLSFIELAPQAKRRGIQFAVHRRVVRLFAVIPLLCIYKGL
jgi:hypothetical protein